MREQEIIEKRIKAITNFYLNVDNIVNNKLPQFIPNEVKDVVIDKILGDKDLKRLIDSLNNHRAPRFIIMGRTGVGKSSLINAMFGMYMAQVSDVKIGTKYTDTYSYKMGGETVLEILDTRGISESSSIKSKSAEEELLDTIESFCPDAILFIVDGSSRSGIDKDVDVLKDVIEKWKEINKIESNNEINIPIITILNRVDVLSPSRQVDPKQYSNRKLENIRIAKDEVKKILLNKRIPYNEIIAVSSYIEWSEDNEIIEEMSAHKRENVTIEFDGRYNIDKLLDILENNININASIGLILATRIDKIAIKLAKKMIVIFAGIAGLIASTPIPFSDIYFITAVQATLIMFISILSGREASFETAKEMIVAFGGAGACGFGLRTLAQQASKLLNGVLPGSGSAISAAIATTGTTAIGNAAIKYFMEDIDLDIISEQVN